MNSHLGLTAIVLLLSGFLLCEQQVQAQAPDNTTDVNPPPGNPGDAGNGTGAAGNPSEPAPPAGPPTSEFKGPSAWLRICKPGAGNYIGVTSTGKGECPAGYWLKESMKIGCVCGHGVWVFASGWCDLSARIVIAYNGSCFNVNKQVRYIRHLGWSNNAFMPYHFVGTSGLEYIQNVPEVLTMSHEATHFHPEYYQHVGAIFRERSVESMTGRFCLSQEGNASRPFTLKYFVPKLPYMQKRNCFTYTGQDLSKFEYDVGYNLNDGLQLIEMPSTPVVKSPSWATPADNEKCAKECPSPQSLVMNPSVNNTLGPDYSDPEFDEYFLADMKDHNISTAGSNTTSRGNESPEANCTRGQYELSDKTMQEIQEQTKRMIQINLRASVSDTPAPGVKFIDYKLMQKSRTILDKVCPEEDVPSTVLTGMHRMFRVALNESFFHYPYDQQGDDRGTNEIWGILTKCFDEAKPMSFATFSGTENLPDTNGTNADNTTTPPSPKTVNPTGADKCDKGKYTGVDYAFPNSNKTIRANMPCHLWNNITDLDLVVETAWKTVVFTHYYCARHFSNHSVAYSLFEQKMEKFFNRWIQHRWYYPGKAFEGYKYIYQSFNLTRFAQALDRCVSAARSFSVYKKWIQRPTYVKFLGGKLFEEQIDVPDEVAGRTSLDAINPKLNKFNRKAYCLPYWHAPVSNLGINYNPANDYKPGCVKYRKEEWENPFRPLMKKSIGWRDTTAFF